MESGQGPPVRSEGRDGLGTLQWVTRRRVSREKEEEVALADAKCSLIMIIRKGCWAPLCSAHLNAFERSPVIDVSVFWELMIN